MRDNQLIESVLVANETTLGAAGATYAKTGVDKFAKLTAVLNVTAKVGTNPTLDVTMEHSADGVVWVVHGTAFTQATDVTKEAKDFTQFLPYVRFKAAIGGTDTPTFNFSLHLAKIKTYPSQEQG